MEDGNKVNLCFAASLCASVEAALQKADSCKNWHQLSSGGSLEVNMGGLPRSTVQSSSLHNSPTGFLVSVCMVCL